MPGMRLGPIGARSPADDGTGLGWALCAGCAVAGAGFEETVGNGGG
jgi:hypothetical protein